MATPLIFNAFILNSASHLNAGQWHQSGQVKGAFLTAEYWKRLALQLEDGLFDGVFFADVLGLHTEKESEVDYCINQGIQFPLHDPAIAISMMASVTENLCFGLTSSVFSESPYLFTRKMATLDHLTGGRMAWNIVTSYLPSSMKALGFTGLPNHEERYSYAQEYLSLCLELWRGAPYMIDSEADGYFSAGKRTLFEGKYLTFSGYGMMAQSPQVYPVLYQAGASKTGLDFAARNTECIFLAGKSTSETAIIMSRVIKIFSRAGRERRSYKIMPQITIITAENNLVAHEKYQEMIHHADVRAAEILASGWLGVDLSKQEPDRPLSTFKSSAIRSFAEQFASSEKHVVPETVKQLVQLALLGGLGTVLVGDSTHLAIELQKMQENGADGFNIPNLLSPDTYSDIKSYLIPELQERGLYKTRYTEGDHRRKLLFNPRI
ncbi:Putative monooxygenase moxC [Serratia fonticola]|uniref:NtaA/DmoA family FMN-dependent monooxygenase n=1 Tax=Serratia fonticola TaxID=47917 RepID=UPI0021835BB3|nr:NtaA/DmoA family FMN-dependent monooxygenase [Serratia fonticola]CAI2143945.1 Putative monooxygenase moxC [Serratia fonticola]